MNPASVQALSLLSPLCLSPFYSPPALYALCEKVTEMGRGAEPCSLSKFN